MSELSASPWDVLASDDNGAVKTLSASLGELDFQLKKLLDEGLSVSEFPVFSGLKAAVEAAKSVVDAKL
ncbi:MAG: hypothetical protein LBE49_07280 [Deltaproteobacteria bacterium]|jgi:hypothetical protein|nr:hypothetical protein [Deltaproteobacteria bacterium]